MLSVPAITVSLSLPCPLQRPFAPPLFQTLFLLYCYFLCSFCFIFQALLLLLFSSLLFYTLLHRSLAVVVTQWPFQISLSIIASDLPQASLQSAMLLDTECREIKVSYKWCSVRGRKFCFCNFRELSTSVVAGMSVQLASCRDGMSRESQSLQVPASLVLLVWPQANPSCEI